MKQLKKNAARAEAVLKLLANQNRLMILCQLVEGERRVSDLLPGMGQEMSQPAISQHLARMRREGIVRAEKRAQSVYYRIDKPEVLPLMQALYDVFCGKAKKGR